ATGFAPNDAQRAPAPGAAVDYDQLIDTQLRRTRAQVKLVEIAGGAMTIGVAVVAFFLVASVLDHWIIPHGLGTIGRVLFCLALVGGAGYFFVRVIFPALLGSVNPIYAAHAIERSKPTLKNSLINFLLFRPRREKMSPHVYRALEEQAANGMSRVAIETAVDRTRLIQIGYVLV